jgi:hypothetical protein
MKIIRTKIGFVRGGKGEPGDPGPPWLGGAELIARVSELESYINERIQLMESVYLKVDTRGSNNGVAELDNRGLVPEYRLPSNIAWVGGEIAISFDTLNGKTITSGIYNEAEGRIEC